MSHNAECAVGIFFEYVNGGDCLAMMSDKMIVEIIGSIILKKIST
jgi:hypothetical protein